MQGRRQASVYILHGWRRLQCRQCVNDGGLQELAVHMEWSMRLIPRTRSGRKFTSGLRGSRVVYARAAGAASAKFVLGDRVKVTSLAELAG